MVVEGCGPVSILLGLRGLYVSRSGGCRMLWWYSMEADIPSKYCVIA